MKAFNETIYTSEDILATNADFTNVTAKKYVGDGSSLTGISGDSLNVKEYGGPLKDKTNYKTFSYDKSSLALFGSSSNNGYFLKTAWSSSLTQNLNSDVKTVAFRIKPERSTQQYHLFSFVLLGKILCLKLQFLLFHHLQYLL